MSNVSQRIAIVNVGIGNIESVGRALRYLGLQYYEASSPSTLATATHIVLPGVGAFRAGMEALSTYGLIDILREIGESKRQRILGVCLGMQLLGIHSEEGDCDGLGLLPYHVQRLRADSLTRAKVPHVGFATISGYQQKGLFLDLSESADFYFTHSYAVREIGISCNQAICRSGDSFVAAFDTGLICGAQFHPEKSQVNGLKLLRNFFSR